MKAISFLEQTVIIAKDQPEYHPIAAHRHLDDEYGRTTFCWKLSWRERMTLIFKGRIWHQVLTFNNPLQPQKLSLEKPDMPV